MPYYSVYVSPNGDYRLCCRSYSIYEDDGGNTLNFRTHSFSEIWNSDSVQKTREKLALQQKIPQCINCIKEEENGKVRGKRFDENEKYYSRHQSLHTFSSPRYLGLALGSKCNLKCRTCNSGYSSFYRKEMADLLKQNPDNARNYSLKLNDVHNLYKSEAKDTWLEDSDLMEHIDFSTLEEVYILGGEPFLISAMSEILERCIEAGNTKLLTRINTNLTSVSDKHLRIIQSFDNLQLIGSIDGIGNLGEYIRYPSRWTVIEKNANRLASMLKPSCQMIIQVTLSLYNVMHLASIYNWFDSFCNEHPEKRITINLNLVHEPDHQNIRNLPADLKSEFSKRMSCLIPRIGNKKFQKQFIEIHDYVMNRDQDADQFQQFLRFSSMLDEYRKQNLLSVCPEFAPYYPPQVRRQGEEKLSKTTVSESHQSF